MAKMDKKTLSEVSKMYGKKCCRVEIGEFRSLSLGFGELTEHMCLDNKVRHYGEWELGTYYGSWRIIKNDRIILGSYDYKDELNILNEKLNEIFFDELEEILNLSAFDIRIKFKSGFMIDMVPASSQEDEFFHIFCPNDRYIEYNSKLQWKSGKSNVPWK